MTAEEHERIEELLAAYALRSLSGADADEAEALLTNHVPRCRTCRETLAAFQAITGELALAANPVDPPELLQRRLSKSLADIPAGKPSRRRLAVALSAAAMIALFALASWGVVLNDRISASQLHAANLQRMIDSVPAGSRMVNLGSPGAQLWAAYSTGATSMRIIGINVPSLPKGHVYRVWLSDKGTMTYGGQFVPRGPDGAVQLSVPVHSQTLTSVFVTEENASVAPAAPSLDAVRAGAQL
jgi:hypothetical protein